MEEEMVSAAREVGGWRRERFKGVVPQPNGHWGAQIYANQQRIWLGTFKSETSAAIAYDSAAMKLRHGDSHTNFPPTALELGFQSQLSTEAVLNMIRDGSYPSHLSEFLRKQGELEIGLNPSSLYGCSCSLLFHKELTPSDVGKLNRLVIPKRYAVKHFPDVPGEQQVQLEVYDEAMSLWKFRYCYWKSSQSFVFTRGWNRFVKDKGLRSNDTVAFYTYQTPHLGKSFLVIHHVAAQAQSSPITITTPNKGFKLFGVQID
ncbi:AP2/ERF and B3 domain-containing transcription factor At1g50680-like [Salvia miltiorrhiza]|uniref:AP2/ERF and B3 domain-containing transcription factor At1g50680-like n=1 Tax=Salvia miltiorrhiza TaxID=226208 RepID=UPI0025AC07F0|nr:AP2/ERF and B3 domain-containing transcription factor At1g50680-like [Salvia miltiorrhiza]